MLVVRRTQSVSCSEPTNTDSTSGYLQDRRRHASWLRPGNRNFVLISQWTRRSPYALLKLIEGSLPEWVVLRQSAELGQQAVRFDVVSP